ncbi:MAG: radical SAM protein [Candidatus Omnitrophica bacterium]|nr:radical SAM protein [Candidatus Omnitrophota bacterium]
MQNAKKIVLANSVGIDRNGYAIIHSPSRWTNSSSNRNVFTYYPWELAYATALLKRETHHTVKLIDGCLKKYDHAQYLDVLCAEKPDYLVMECSTRTWEDDKTLALAVKQRCDTKLIIAGQHAIAYPEEVSTVADHILIGEYEMTLLDIFRDKPLKDIRGLYPNPPRELLDVNFLPLPEDEDVSRFDYAIPGEPSSEYIEIQAYASRGCPFHCSFCVAGTMYYQGKPSWRPRRVSSIIKELVYLKSKYPRMQGIFFDEEYHNVNKAFIMDLCHALKEHDLNDLKIDAMCAYATLDREMMQAMKESGYYMLRIGIETAATACAAGVNLGAKHNIAKLKQVLREAKEIGLKMYGTFTFGAPGSTYESDQETLGLMDQLINRELLWRYQTSICTPQPGTPYYRWAKEQGYLRSENAREFDGGNFVVVEYPNYKKEQIAYNYFESQRFYDIALCNRFKHTINDNIEKITAHCTKDTKVLLVRSSRPLQMKEAIKALTNAEERDFRLDILVQDDVAEEYRAMDEVTQAFSYGKGYMDVETFDKGLLRSLSDEAYDHIIIVYGNSQGQGYENVHTVVQQIQCPKVWAMTSEGRVIECSETGRTGKVGTGRDLSLQSKYRSTT